MIAHQIWCIVEGETGIRLTEEGFIKSSLENMGKRKH